MKEIKCTDNTFSHLYVNAFKKIILHGEHSSPRGMNVYEVSPAILILKNPRNRLLSFNKMRNIKRYCYGEALWYLSGSNRLDFIEQYSKFWKQISDDGITCNSAYGKYIFRDTYVTSDYDITNQWDFVKNTLREDTYSRQAIVHIKPIQTLKTKDVVCTLTLQFMIRNDKLDLIVEMRSNDFVKGLTYDVFQFTLLQELMAAELGISLGRYIHIANNLHIYEKDMQMLEEMIVSGINKNNKPLPPIPADFRTNDLLNLLKGNEPQSDFAKEFIKYDAR